jgi:glycosyltransferase involved in cell wall biosynthesis
VAEPLVSVVMPTRQRPELAVRAARSVLVETDVRLEVVAVVDGPDAKTVRALDALADERIRVKQLAERGGPGAARNTGVRVARARRIAFLDDDDEWRPGKLAAQLPLAERHPLVAACVLARDARGRGRVWPRRLPDRGEPLAEYLLARRGLLWGEGLVQLSTVVADRALLERVPFREDLRVHEDLDWLLRVSALAGVLPVFASPGEPLAIWNVDDPRRRASTAATWEESLAWIRSVRELVTPQAYAGFVLTLVAPAAARARRPAALPLLLRDAFRNGRPRALDVVVALGSWIVPVRLRQRLA